MVTGCSGAGASTLLTGVTLNLENRMWPKMWGSGKEESRKTASPEKKKLHLSQKPEKEATKAFFKLSLADRIMHMHNGEGPRLKFGSKIFIKKMSL